MPKKVKVPAIARYHGHNIRPNESVDFSLKFEYGEMTNCVKLLQLLNENIIIAARVGVNDPKKLGMFMIKSINFSSDGECIAKFNSTLDFVEQNNFSGLAGEILNVLFKAEIDVEEEQEDDE